MTLHIDLGCGTGAELKYVFQRVPHAHAVCIDLSQGMLCKLKQDFEKFSDNIETICGSYMDMDFGTDRYDYVIACNTLHHILKEDKILLYQNIKKSLKKGGYMLIEDYVVSEEEEKEYLANYLKLIKNGLLNSNVIYHIDLTLSENSERELLQLADFKEVILERIGENGIYIIAMV